MQVYSNVENWVDVEREDSAGNRGCWSYPNLYAGISFGMS